MATGSAAEPAGTAPGDPCTVAPRLSPGAETPCRPAETVESPPVAGGSDRTGRPPAAAGAPPAGGGAAGSPGGAADGPVGAPGCPAPLDPAGNRSGDPAGERSTDAAPGSPPGWDPFDAKDCEPAIVRRKTASGGDPGRIEGWAGPGAGALARFPVSAVRRTGGSSLADAEDGEPEDGRAGDPPAGAGRGLPGAGNCCAAPPAPPCAEPTEDARAGPIGGADGAGPLAAAGRAGADRSGAVETAGGGGVLAPAAGAVAGGVAEIAAEVATEGGVAAGAAGRGDAAAAGRVAAEPDDVCRGEAVEAGPGRAVRVDPDEIPGSGRPPAGPAAGTGSPAADVGAADGRSATAPAQARRSAARAPPSPVIPPKPAGPAWAVLTDAGTPAAVCPGRGPSPASGREAPTPGEGPGPPSPPGRGPGGGVRGVASFRPAPAIEPAALTSASRRTLMVLPAMPVNTPPGSRFPSVGMVRTARRRPRLGGGNSTGSWSAASGCHHRGGLTTPLTVEGLMSPGPVSRRRRCGGCASPDTNRVAAAARLPSGAGRGRPAAVGLAQRRAAALPRADRDPAAARACGGAAPSPASSLICSHLRRGSPDG